MRLYRDSDSASDLLCRLVRSCWSDLSQESRVTRSQQIVLQRLPPLTQGEYGLLQELRRRLIDDEWSRLPQYVEAILDDRPFEFVSDRGPGAEARQRLKAKEKREEAQRRAAEHKRRIAEGERQRRAEEERQRRTEKERRRREAEERRLAEERREAEERQRRKAEERRQHAELERQRAAVIEQLEHLFESEFLTADARYARLEGQHLLPRTEYEALKAKFVREWAARELDLQLDEQQAAAVASTSGNVRVVARAGSGKTRTLTTRALFLQMHCGVQPRQIMLLAFNRDAANEMKKRLRTHLGDELPHVMTFHSLAYALVHPEEDLIYDRVEAEQERHSREVQNVIDEFIRSPAYGPRIRELMLKHFRADWSRITSGGYDLPKDLFLEHRRSMTSRSLKGDYIKSFGEKVIANILFEHDIPYKYERYHSWDGATYRPDFTIEIEDGPKVVIEYFGLRDDQGYDEMSDKKREFWRKRPDWQLLEYSPSNLVPAKSEAFKSRLLQDLRRFGVWYRKLSDEEIWMRIGERAIGDFTRATKQFIGRCRKLDWPPEALRAKKVDRCNSLLRAKRDSSSSVEALFLDVATPIYAAYLDRLAECRMEDFDGLMLRAAEQVTQGGTRFTRDRGRETGDLRALRFLMIDEYQDFSKMFFDLTQAIRRINPEVGVFCVGDDWQAINGFAGSDLAYFKNFEEYFGQTRRLEITTNYRSDRAIVNIGNELMRGRGTKSNASSTNAGRIQLCRMNDFQPSPIELENHDGNRITPAMLRLVYSLLSQRTKVALLCRKNEILWPIRKRGAGNLERFLEHLRSFLPENVRDDVTASTVHKYKGLESAAVIVLDGIRPYYPLVHPNWIFQRIFGDSLAGVLDEERRLFYVGLTRAIGALYIVSESGQMSPFLSEIHSTSPIASLDWHGLAPPPSLDGEKLEVRVYNAYDIKDELNGAGYRFHHNGQPYWFRVVPREGFEPTNVLQRSWNGGRVRIDVLLENGDVYWSSRQ